MSSGKDRINQSAQSGDSSIPRGHANPYGVKIGASQYGTSGQDESNKRGQTVVPNMATQLDFEDKYVKSKKNC
jgi:hypothetical protein